jgi:hypothetical protein
MEEALRKAPGLLMLEGIEAELLADEAFYLSGRGGDPTPILVRGVPLLERAEKVAPQDVNVIVARALTWVAEARWRSSKGSDPTPLLDRAEKHIATLGPRTGEDAPQEYLARIALERARWLTRNGKPASPAAADGLSRVKKALEARPGDPDLWVLEAQLEALGGNAPSARASLQRAWAINPLVRGGPDSHAAEALLATR